MVFLLPCPGNDQPLPLLVDYHGWTGHAGNQESDGHDFFAVADEDEEGGFLLVTPNGMGDVGEGRWLHLDSKVMTS